MTLKVCVHLNVLEALSWLRSKVENMLWFFFFFTHWPHLCRSSADVSCHVLAALPVPLGQCDGHPAVSGYFLRHHPAAPWDAAWTNHHPHDWWVHRCTKNDRSKDFLDVLLWFWLWVWLLMCWIRLSQAWVYASFLILLSHHIRWYIKRGQTSNYWERALHCCVCKDCGLVAVGHPEILDLGMPTHLCMQGQQHLLSNFFLIVHLSQLHALRSHTGAT